MISSRTVEYAAAIRMTCCNPDVPGAARQAPVVVFSGKSAAREAAAQCATKTADGILAVAANAPAAEVAKAVAAHIREAKALPATVAVRETGLFGVGMTGAAAVNNLAKLVPGTAPVDVVAPPARPRVGGCVAVVTGSAQGFGKGIAEELAREGASVVIADINEALGSKTVDELNARHGAHTAVFCPLDVTRLASIDACVEQTALAFGGIDIFVSNAGVLKAGGLHEMDEGAFDLVTSVNYKAYFLCAKSVSALMKLQHQFNPSHVMDIVQINSKSGLEGSNRNFAYAGSKFGGIGLTQSFAMELVPHRIKVNAICPGNYFDGPLWADPDKGLFVQYLRTGKVPGAKTIDDVRKFYLSKIPMNRGCLPADVATAIFYLHDQQYETGQALPVTGGQVMLN